MAYIQEKTIKNNIYYYLIKDTRIGKKKKKYQVYLGKNKIPTKEKILELENKINKPINKKYNYKPIINSVKNIFKDTLSSIILFGSYAKETQRKDSDIDILLICKKLPRHDRRQQMIQDMQYQYLQEKKKKLSFILITDKEFEDWIKNENPLLYGIVTGYKYLYDKEKFFRKNMVKFKNILKITNPVYVEDGKKIPLAYIV